jgi:restriction endonuclease S subunit
MTWKAVKLGEICKIINGSTPLRSQKNYWEGGTIPWFTIDDFREQGHNINYTRQKITKHGFENTSLRMLPKNTVLLCCTASIGVSAIARVEMTTNQQFNGLISIKDELIPEFLYYISTTITKKLMSLSGSTTINFIAISKLKEIKISFPSILEQKQIVAKLDKACSEINKTVDFIKAKEQEVISLYETILSSDFELSSTSKKLNEVCKIYNGGTPNTKNKIYWGGKTQWLTPRDMGKLTNEYVDSTLRQLTEEGLKNSSANLIPKKSIILSCRAPIGHLAINNVPMSFNQGCKGLVADSTILHYRYLYYFLLSSKKLLNDLGKGTTFKEISSKVLSNVEINVPSLNIQKTTVNKLDLIFNDLQKLKDINRKQIENYAILKKALINEELAPKAA